jgi:hypothetical protein
MLKMDHYYRTPIFFIFITLLCVQTSFCRVRKWEDIKTKNEKDWLRELKDDYHKTMRSPEYRCFSFRKMEDIINKFSDRVEEESANRWDVLNFIWNLVIPTDSMIYDLKQHMITTQQLFNDFSFRMQVAEEVHELEEEKIDGSVFNIKDSINLQSSKLNLVGKIRKAEFSELKSMEAVPDKKVNYITLGRHFAEQLFRGRFSCYSIPELSIYIFKLFYFNIVKKEYILRIFKGFFEYLVRKGKDVKDNQVREELMRKFYGFNLKIFLYFDSEFATNILDMFRNDDKKTYPRLLIENFTNLYLFVLKTINTYEVDKKANIDEYIDYFVKNDSKTLERAGRKASMLVAIYTVNYLKSLAESILPPGIKEMVSHHTSPILSSIHETIREICTGKKNEDEIVEYYTTNIDNKKVVIPMKDIKNFSENFKMRVEACNNCEMCQANALFNDFYVFEKHKTQTESPIKII